MTNKQELFNTYNRLRNGERKYLEALNVLVEYKVTNGRLQSQVEPYLKQDQMKLRFYIYIGLLCITGISTLILLLALRIHPVISSTVSLLISAYAIFQFVYLWQYLKKSQVYVEVYNYINAYKPGALEQIYSDYLEKQGKSKKR